MILLKFGARTPGTGDQRTCFARHRFAIENLVRTRFRGNRGGRKYAEVRNFGKLAEWRANRLRREILAVRLGDTGWKLPPGRMRRT